MAKITEKVLRCIIIITIRILQTELNCLLFDKMRTVKHSVQVIDGNKITFSVLCQNSEGRFPESPYFTDARMWTQCTPQKLDIVCAVSSLYINNLAS